jgi:hypothetical protein
MSMPRFQFVPHLPDLISPEDYASDPDGTRVRLRIRATPDGLEILGDAQRVKTLEDLLEALGPAVIEQMLCG